MPAQKKAGLPALTSLRFFAALAIVVHHCNGVFWPAVALGPLDVGVSFFFVLSGFILTYVYRDMAPGGSARVRFYRARVARIWPLHLTCLLLTILLIRIPEPFDPAVLLANLLLLQAWIPFDRFFFSYNYVAWSISTELFFYLLLPLLVVHARRWIGTGILLALIAVAVLAVGSDQAELGRWETTGNQLSATGLLYTNPLARLAEFLIGVAAGLIFMQRRDTDVDAGITTRWSMVEIGSIALLLCAYWFLLSGFAPIVHRLWLMFGMTALPLGTGADETALLEQISPLAGTLVTEWADHVGLTPFAVAVIYVFAHQRGRLSHLLSQRWLVFCGEISFALYLVHQITLRWVQQHFTQLGFGAFLVFMASVLLLAALLHRLIEQPCRRWLTRQPAA